MAKSNQTPSPRNNTKSTLKMKDKEIRTKRKRSVDNALCVDDEGDYDLKLKCRPRSLVEFISTMTEGQKSAVREIGFGGLLTLQVTKFPKNIMPWFLKAFDNGSHLFKVLGCSFLMTKADIKDCFLLPDGPYTLELIPTARTRTKHSQEVSKQAKVVKDEWRRKFNTNGQAIPLGRIYDELKGCKEDGDYFKRLFVVYAMSIFLAPTSNSSVDLKIIKAVEDVNRIPHSDWCSYIFEHLVKTTKDTKKGVVWYRGCVLILFMTYFHRYDFQGHAMPSDLPLLQHWTNKMLNDRAKGEMETMSLGNVVLSKAQYPRSVSDAVPAGGDKDVDNVSVKRKAGVDGVVDLNRDCVNLGSEPRQGSGEKRFIRFELGECVDDDVQIKEKAIDDVHELYLLIQRDSYVFHDIYLKRIAEIKEKLAARVSSSSDAASPPVQMTPTQAFFANPALHRYVDEVVLLARSLKSAAANAPSLRCCLS